MKRKKYEVAGMMEWHPVFKVGRTRLRVSFTGGHLCGGASTAASFETSDPVVQKVIEASPAFRSGRIRLGREWTIGDQSIPEAGSKTAGSPSLTSEPAVRRPEGRIAETEGRLTVMEFDDIDHATDFLQRDKGVELEHIITADQCVAEARKLGIDLKIKK